ncbi:MAG: S-methyl-5'-thioadenosine phosphorylase [Holosporales bacterium]
MGKKIGIIGGSGLYALEGISTLEWCDVKTPFGEPSDAIGVARLGAAELFFLPRHGRGHRHNPSDINYRANIAALKILGVTDVISVSAVGSLRSDRAPGSFVFVDQFIDRTINRANTFFISGCVAHVSMAEPTCTELSQFLFEQAKALGLEAYLGGTYLAMEGPQFSSLAESKLYQSWGCDVIGMTNMPEAKLAREAELAYASMACVTDYDCWHQDHGHVNVETVLKILTTNIKNSQKLLTYSLPLWADYDYKDAQGCYRSLDNAIITAPQARDLQLVECLRPIAGRIL